MQQSVQHNRREEGNEAERVAAEWLKSKGWTILKTNFHFGRLGEIDIIAEDGKTLVFVEVKSRTNAAYGRPEESLSASKVHKLRKAAEGYLFTHRIANRDCRFDLVAIDSAGGTTEIRHIVNAF